MKRHFIYWLVRLRNDALRLCGACRSRHIAEEWILWLKRDQKLAAIIEDLESTSNKQ